MLNYVWSSMLIIALIFSFMTGKTEYTMQIMMKTCKDAIEVCIGLLGIMCFWTGIMNIAQRNGVVEFFSKILTPITNLLFPEVPKEHPAKGAIVMNMVANFLGMGNAATPFGIKAMQELQKLNHIKDTATKSMSTFLVLNSSSIQVIPATIISLRASQGSKNPGEIIITIWVTSILAAIGGIVVLKILNYKKSRGKKWLL